MLVRIVGQHSVPSTQYSVLSTQYSELVSFFVP